ncbi:flagellar hook-associated protein FlgK [Pseudobacteroides cellulosolvens]|uniref:Flagellar hook-associated protein 1 n=1 Tax=Pseudobacteroides cellulosolvens ATCC 35603 = DSM 2933 TaxID=398512 RepID=A0A0L6JS50_9FIRM|nr:flagellar hook-associated protein FlgK [Pseudobacteroides cellulosolvens]KNY28628.1 flagellar hook-associated protein FlgK [Pseudobacteroides cellulosolvens ATCC 35603 = DSM 2933]
MGVSFASIEIARSGLYVNERGLSVTGHNISNVNTPGYARQQVALKDSLYQRENGYDLGLGADIQKIRQIRHSFLDNVYRMESESLGYWETREKTFNDIQAVMGEPMNEGLQSVMNEYWNSWHELSKNPESLTTRALTRQRGEALVQYINHLGSQFDKLQSDLDSELRVKVDEINGITKNVADLNVKILSVETAGDSANDLRDQRNVLLDRISKLADCVINEIQDGQVEITIGGYFLVSRGISERLKTVENQKGSMFSAVALEKTGTLVPIKNGVIKGLMEARGEVAGTIGSFGNGSPNDKIDLVFAFNTDDSAARRDELYNNIDKIVNDYTSRGIGVRLGYVTFDSTGITAPTTFVDSAANSNGVYVPDINSFKDQIGSTDSGLGISFKNTVATGIAVPALQDAENAANQADILTEWRNVSRQIIIYSNNSIDPTGLNTLGTQFENNRINTAIISDISNKNSLKGFTDASGAKFIDNAASGTSIIDSVSETVRNSIYGNTIESNDIISNLKNRINLMVNALTREVNSLHRSGYNLNGTNGIDFFVPINPYYPMQMGNIMVNPKLSDLKNIVTSVNGSVGDNTVATAIYELRHKAMMGNTSNVQNFDDFYRSIVGDIGNGGSEARTASTGQTTLVNSADSARQAITSVSMDEEMTNMMKYQFAYNAAARVLNVFDEMFESIVNKLGLVGR